MPTLHKSRWFVTDAVTGKRRQTRYLMTEADARELDPTAEPVPGSLMVIHVPDNPTYAMSTSAWQRRGPADQT